MSNQRGRRRGKRVATILSKGGVGKTSFTIGFSVCAAADGKVVVLVDLDALPGITEWFNGFQSARGGEDIMAPVRRDPKRHAVDRLLIDPGAGLNGLAKEWPLWDSIMALPTVERKPISRINPATIVETTIRNYQLDQARVQAGKLYLIPNAGTLDGIIQQLQAQKLKQASFDMYGALDEALAVAEEAHYQQTGEEIDLWVFDCAGERSIPPALAAHAADFAFQPFEAELPALAGLINSSQDLQRVQTRRGGQYPKLIPVVNKYIAPGSAPADEDEGESQAAWLDRFALPALAELGVALDPIRIPFSRDLKRAASLGILPWWYNPNMPAMLATRDLYWEHKEEIFAH